MRAKTTEIIMIPPTHDNEINIVNRREIEPMLCKARQVLMHYDKAMELNTAVLDRAGQFITTTDYEKQARFCELCKKYCHNPLQIWQEKTQPCDKVQLDALAESRQTGKTHIYTCAVGFTYWTSPLYRNGHYTGALATGQVLSCSRKEAAEKFRIHCKDRIATEKFKKMLEDVAEKSNEEILAMARLLEICARKIPEEREVFSKTIRRIIKWEDETKKVKTPVLENQVEKERLLLAAFQRGDNHAGYKILDELLHGVSANGQHNIELERVRAIELVVLLSRSAAISKTSPHGVMLKTNDKNIKRILASKTTKELTENLHLVAEQLAGEIFYFRGIRHSSALRKAQRYIWENLDRKISLRDIAKAAGLSAPYFSTIFREEMEENLSAYINRLRVEKAAILLKETENSIKTITKLCGFQDQSWFSKIFKKATGITPGKYRETGSFAGDSYAP
jgi:AraC-like DNA-binding protein/ligand-binding sensor protein